MLYCSPALTIPSHCQKSVYDVLDNDMVQLLHLIKVQKTNRDSQISTKIVFFLISELTLK